MKVLYLFNKVLGKTIEDYRAGKGHDSWCFGMLRLPKYGIAAGYLEIEQFIPAGLAKFLRKHILTMHYAHLPLFPLFFKYDVVFTSTAYASLIFKSVLRIKKFKWIILDFNVLGTIGNEKKVRQKIYAWAVSKADGVVCISEAAAAAMKAHFPSLTDRIIFLREATDPGYFKPSDSHSNTRPAGGDHATIPSIISVGNFGRDFDTVIEATKGLGVQCRLATKLISPMATKSLPSHVTVKSYSHAEILEAYRQAVLAVVVIALKDDYYDSVGTFALGEAMAMGKAVIVTHTKSMESYINDGVNGVFVKYKDVNDMREKIAGLLNDSPRREKIGVEARKFAEEFLDSEKFAASLATYLKELVSENIC